MSMLAEPRRKQKISIDPRGNNWSNDESKFGQKMLERMGWKKGCGLGLKQDGKTDHIKVAYKANNKGVGCSNSHADNWIAHQDDFNALLANLNKDHGKNTEMDEPHKVVSLEKKSKSSKSRVHYQKFTKVKDLSLKSSDDLDCIFGKRKRNSTPSTPQGGSEASSELQENFGVQTVKSDDNLQEYFAKKMAQLKTPKNNVDLTNDKKECSDDEQCHSLNESLKTAKRVRFEISGSDSEDIASLPQEAEETNKQEVERKNKTKKSKKKKKDTESIKNCPADDHHKPNACKKKRKKKKEYEKKEYADTVGAMNKKKKKKEKENNEEIENAVEFIDCNSEKIHSPKKKKKSKNKESHEQDKNASLIAVDPEKYNHESSCVENDTKRKVQDECKTNMKRKNENSNSSLEVKTICQAFVGSNLEQLHGYTLPSASMAHILGKYKNKRNDKNSL